MTERSNAGDPPFRKATHMAGGDEMVSNANLRILQGGATEEVRKSCPRHFACLCLTMACS